MSAKRVAWTSSQALQSAGKLTHLFRSFKQVGGCYPCDKGRLLFPLSLLYCYCCDSVRVSWMALLALCSYTERGYQMIKAKKGGRRAGKVAYGVYVDERGKGR